MYNAGNPSGGYSIGQPGAGTQLHWLRQRERTVLSDMVKMAVPLDAQGNTVSEPYSTASASSAVPVVSTWRLLIFDDWGRDIIAPLLKVGDLRELGVTLYLHIATERDPVPGAPAIYFCAPTEENIRRIAKDCGNALYEWVYLNFTTQIPRDKLELLASQLSAAQLPSIRHIRVYDRTLSYVALENDLFSLMLDKSFLLLNRMGATEEEINAHLDSVVQGVSHVCLSLQVLPIIAHSRTDAAQEVAKRLSTRLNDALNDRQLTPASSATLGRPLLLLVDRSSDLATALHHPFTYRGLLVDAGDMRLNKCCIQTSDGHDEVIEIDPDKDVVYRDNAGLEFGQVGRNIELALQTYKQDYAALSSESAGMMEDGDGNNMSKLLANAPALAERKRFLDAHTKLAFSFLGKIKTHHLDAFHGVELGILQREGLDKEEFHNLLANKIGTLEDRQRLYLLAYLMCTKEEEVAWVQEHANCLGDEPFPALAYLQHLRSWSLSAQSPSAKQPNASEGFGWGFAQQIAKNIASTLGGNSETQLPLTKLVDALLSDGRAPVASPTMYSPSSAVGGGNLREQLLSTVSAYDPRTKKPVDLTQAQCAQAVVFVLGGGSVAEYDDLKRWEVGKVRKSVMYGCTSLTSGYDMLHQLSALGKQTSS